jgi:hypothetical protein
MSSAWLLRNVHQLCDGGQGPRYNAPRDRRLRDLEAEIHPE